MVLTITDLYRGAGSKFFDDQLMYSQDLNNIEYTKLETIRNSIKSMIIQPGVAIHSLSESALKVEYVDAKHFTINPGYAVDKFGRLIYVPSSTAASGSIYTDPYYHPAWPDRQNIAHNQLPEELTTYYVNIYYTTQQGISGTNDEGTSFYTREYDSYRISVENVLPSENSGGLCLASFPINTDGDIPSSGSINDIRPLLLCAIQTFTTPAREIFRKSIVATDVANNSFAAIAWQSGDLGPDTGVLILKARTSFRYYGEAQVNIHFTASAASDPGSVKVIIATVFDTYNFAGAGSYSFSINLPTTLLSNVLYDVTVSLANVNPTDVAMISEMVIDVI